MNDSYQSAYIPAYVRLSVRQTGGSVRWHDGNYYDCKNYVFENGGAGWLYICIDVSVGRRFSCINNVVTKNNIYFMYLYTDYTQVQ